MFALPDKVTNCGLLVALSVSVKLPLVGPELVGLDETLIAHELCAARLVPQVLVWAKSALIEIPLILTVARLGLVTVTVCAGPVPPTL